MFPALVQISCAIGALLFLCACVLAFAALAKGTRLDRGGLAQSIRHDFAARPFGILSDYLAKRRA